MLWSRNGRKSDGSVKGVDSDARLLVRLKDKDQDAYLMLYDLHHRSVFRFLMHMTGSIETAEELTQEVFVVILDAMCSGSIGHFNPEKGTLEGYLIGIARNVARAERRRLHRYLPLDNLLETPEWDRLLLAMSRDAGKSDLAMVLAAQSEIKALYRAILELPDHYRAVVVLCSLQEKSYRDAAAILECTEGTIASRMNRAKASLAAKIRKSESYAVISSVEGRGKEGMDAEPTIK